MTNRRVLSKIARGIYFTKTASHQYFAAGSRREGWTVEAFSLRANGSPDSSSGRILADAVTLWAAEQAIINDAGEYREIVSRAATASALLS